MCLAIPLKIKKIDGDFAQVESAGLLRNVNIQMLKDLKVGDYVMVHAGFAIEKIDEKQAKKTLKIIDEIH